MKRMAWLIVAGGLVAAAFVAPEPDVPGPPAAFETGQSADVVADFAGVWHCPVTSATLERDTTITAAVVERAAASLTFPNPIPGEEPERARFALAGPGAAALELSDVALRGDAPGFVEFTTREAAAFAVISSDESQAGDACVDSAPKVWYLPGSSTQEGESITVRLFNPFPEPARITVLAVSEIGSEPLPELQDLTVPVRSWRDFPLEDTLRFRDTIGFTVSNEEGLAFPAVIIANQLDQASWAGTASSTLWEFPVARIAGLSPQLIFMNPADAEVEAVIDVFTPEGAVPAALTVSLPPQAPLAVPVDDLAEGPMGLRVTTSSPVAVAVRSSGGSGLAGTIGARQPATRWLLPGAEPDLNAVASAWVLNSGAEPVTVTVQPLGGDAATASKLAVQAGTVRQVIAPATADGFLISSALPVSAAWSVEAPGGVAFVAGAAVAEG